MGDQTEIIRAARGDQRELEKLIEINRSFILYQAFKAARHFVTINDDEWSIALFAFTEAVNSWDEERGPFKPFAALVIKRRVADYIQTEARHAGEISIEPQVFGGEFDEDEDGVNSKVRQTMLEVVGYADDEATPGSSAARDEIEAVQQALRPYGFSFMDLTSCSPKADKTRRSCAAVIGELIKDEGLIALMRRDKMLPMKYLTERSGVERRIMERHRRYIIAAAEILTGDFPLLSSYLEGVREYISGKEKKQESA